MPRNDEFRFLSLSERVGLILKMELFIQRENVLRGNRRMDVMLLLLMERYKGYYVQIKN